LTEPASATLDLLVSGRRKATPDRAAVAEIIKEEGVAFDPSLIIETVPGKLELLRTKMGATTTQEVADHLNRIAGKLQGMPARLATTKDTHLAYLWKDRYGFTAFELLPTDINGVEQFAPHTIFEGRIDSERVEVFGAEAFEKMDDVARTLGGAFENPILDAIPLTLKANFIFIRSLLDYQSITISEALAATLLDIYTKAPFLFEPSNPFWAEATKGEKLGVLLLRLSGMFQRPFEQVIGNWISMIEFLRTECGSDAANFFEVMAGKLGLDPDNPKALEKMQLILERKTELPFTYAKKNGRFLLSSMADTRRGHNVLKHVTHEHLLNFNLPVDSQIIRVSLNTGLLKMTTVNSETITLPKGKGKQTITGQGRIIMRSDLTEPCQAAWRLVSERVGMVPAEIDFYVWSNGSLLCKHFGNYCFVCPFTAACESWTTRLVRESRGAEWTNGSFSFCRPQSLDALILRDENTPNVQEKYDVRVFSAEQETLDPRSLKILSKEKPGAI
jgi:hypothetical protein